MSKKTIEIKNDNVAPPAEMDRPPERDTQSGVESTAGGALKEYIAYALIKKGNLFCLRRLRMRNGYVLKVWDSDLDLASIQIGNIVFELEASVQ
jgi:hypothetical protein